MILSLMVCLFECIILLCKTKKQYMLACKVSIYYILGLYDRIAILINVMMEGGGGEGGGGGEKNEYKEEKKEEKK